MDFGCDSRVLRDRTLGDGTDIQSEGCWLDRCIHQISIYSEGMGTWYVHEVYSYIISRPPSRPGCFSHAISNTFAWPPTLCGPQSPNPRYHDKPLLFISPAKLPSVPALLLARPQPHRHQSRHQKDHRAPAPRHQPHPDPRHRFEHVVRARHEPESPPLRDTSLRAAAAAEIAQHHVRAQIAHFADDVQQECGVGDIRIGRPGGGSGRPVGPEGDVSASEEPVVGRIFENVQEWHGGGGESVDEDGFKLAFDEVKHYECEGERLELGWAGRRR